MIRALTLIASLAFDLAFGEPPEKLHPVVWFGKVISALERLNTGNRLSLLSGAFVVSAVVAFALLLSRLPEFVGNKILSFLIAVFFLKSTFSIRAMLEHVYAAVKSDFEANTVQMLVSRNVKELNHSLRCSAVIESLAENFVDSVFSPLFYYVLFGLPGAMVYRAVNTCDAMIGYKNERYFWFGKFAARLDDVLNYVPARLAVFILAIIFDLRVLKAFEGVEGKVNACSMVAMAYALDVRLEKAGYYVINPSGRKPDRKDVLLALRYFKILTAVLAGVFLLLLLL